MTSPLGPRRASATRRARPGGHPDQRRDGPGAERSAQVDPEPSRIAARTSAPTRTARPIEWRPWSATGSGNVGRAAARRASSSSCRHPPRRTLGVVAVARLVRDRDAESRAQRRAPTGARTARSARHPTTYWRALGAALAELRLGRDPVGVHVEREGELQHLALLVPVDVVVDPRESRRRRAA